MAVKATRFIIRGGIEDRHGNKYKGEEALAAAVLVQILEDISLYEKTCDKEWRERDAARKINIQRHASDAIGCVFGNNKTLPLWLSLAGIPVGTFRKMILEAFPRACEWQAPAMALKYGKEFTV